MLQQQQQPQTGTQTTTVVVQPVLHLRPGEAEKKKQKSRSKVHWTEDVVDNEHMNKKKTKICCIFHPQREFGESSDSSDSSDSDSDSSDSSDDEGMNNFDTHNHDHDHENEESHDHVCNHGSRKKSSPNAYEVQPHYRNQSSVPDKAI